MIESNESEMSQGGHPIQPLIEDEKGVERFKRNAIVCKLLDDGPFDMNDIAMWNVSREDREQFAQLIGYSWCGACDLGYISDEVITTARRMKDEGQSEDAARADVLRAMVNEAKEKMRDGVAALFGLHPDDLIERP